MTDITITKTEKIPVKYLKVCAHVRYWEDAHVNGMLEDDDNPTIPCRDGKGNWSPLIDLDTGKIIDWPPGNTASTHYKVCDEGRYALLREDKYALDFAPVRVEAYFRIVTHPRVRRPARQQRGRRRRPSPMPHTPS